MAATDEIVITVHGKGGHAAMPHLTVDPVVATAQVISALQTIASRNCNPLDAIVVTVCSMETSQTNVFNVIPDFVKLIGTVRSFRPETREMAEARIKEIVAGVAKALGGSARDRVQARLSVHHQYRARGAVRSGSRRARIRQKASAHRRRADQGGEDFLHVQVRPGAYVFLGQGGGPKQPASCTSGAMTSPTR
jgi:hippurate hydrolase